MNIVFGEPMRESLSHTVQEVIKSANEIAREFHQEYVGTEHLLLAIARRGESVGAQILEQHDVTPAMLRKRIDKLAQASMDETWVFGRLPGTPHFRNVVANAIEQARAHDSNHVCSQHILLGLLMEKDCVAQRALDEVGVTVDSVRKCTGLMREAEA